MGKSPPEGAIIFSAMKTLRAVLLSALFAAVFAGGTARAEESPSAEPVRVAQAESGDNRPATLGDINRLEARSEKRMDRVEDRIGQLEDRMVEMFLALLIVMVALFGIPQFPDWWNRLRANGKSGAAAGILLVVAVVGVTVAAIAIAG